MSKVKDLVKKYDRFILHFDVNKTLIIQDTAGSKPTSLLVNQIIMENIYGELTTEFKKDDDFEKNIEKNVKKFKIRYLNPVLLSLLSEKDKEDIKKKLGNELSEKNDDSFIRFDQYLEFTILKYPIRPKEMDKQEFLKIKRKIKNRRNDFAEKEFLDFENLGNFFRGAKKKMMEKLKLNNGLILPSLYDTMKKLRAMKLDFSIVFRTYGGLEDIDIVLKEYNEFCKKEKFDDKLIDINEHSQFGCCYRSEEEGDQLMLGTFDFSKKDDEKTKKIKGKKNIYKYIIESTKEGKSLALRDYYWYWSCGNELPEFGKIFFVSTSNDEIFQIFYDDNTFFGVPGNYKGIVDLCDVDTDKHLNYIKEQDKYLGSYVHAVEPIHSIMNDSYFYNLFEKSVLRFNKK